MTVSSLSRKCLVVLLFGVMCSWPGVSPIQFGEALALADESTSDPTEDYPDETEMPDEPNDPDETGNPDTPEDEGTNPPPSTPGSEPVAPPPSTITPGELAVRHKPFTQGCAGQSIQNWGTAEQRRRNAALRARNANDVDCSNDEQ
jgi:hypothetical protein